MSLVVVVSKGETKENVQYVRFKTYLQDVMGLRSCCCGCSVKTGSLIVGHVCRVLSCVGVLMSLLAMTNVDGVVKAMTIGHENQEMQIQMIGAVVSKAYFLFAVMGFKNIIINWLLIHGIKQTKPAYVLPWIVVYGGELVLQVLVLFCSLGLSISIPAEAWYAGTIAFTLYFFFEMYILVVVSSHYHSMKKSSLLDEEQIMM